MSQIASIPASSSAQTTAAACLRARTGAFLIAPAQALALRPKAASSLRITCGNAWITMGDGVDHFLVSGQTLHAPAGSHVVLESVQRGSTLKFDWQPAMEVHREQSAIQSPQCQSPQAQSPQTRSPVAQALGDLRCSATFAARGLSGLAMALMAVLLGGAARVLGTGFAALARKAHSNASRAQGRMASCESMASSGAV